MLINRCDKLARADGLLRSFKISGILSSPCSDVDDAKFISVLVATALVLRFLNFDSIFTERFAYDISDFLTKKSVR